MLSPDEPSSPTAAAVTPENTKDPSKTTTIGDNYLSSVRSRLSNVPPPKPATNPLQFVKARPCSLYRSAQEQLKRSEEVKQAKLVVREDAEDWQSNLDNWKSSRRKRVEHIIDRVVEAKKLEQEEHNRNRRRSKTFSEMLEERSGGSRRKPSLAFYAEEDDSTNFSDSTELEDNVLQEIPTISDKSATSEDSDTNNTSTKKEVKQTVNGNVFHSAKPQCDLNSKSNTTPTTEYTYEGAINDYKSRVINWENRNGFNNKKQNETANNNIIVPKAEILKRTQIFENKILQSNETPKQDKTIPTQCIKERLCLLEIRSKSSENISSVRDRLSNLQQRTSQDTIKIQNEIAPCSADSITSADLPLVRSGSSNENVRHPNDYNDTDRDDSGIHTADVSCSVSQADEAGELEESLINQTYPQYTAPLEDYQEEYQEDDDEENNSVSLTVADDGGIRDNSLQVSEAIDIALEEFDRQNSIASNIEEFNINSSNVEQEIETAMEPLDVTPKKISSDFIEVEKQIAELEVLKTDEITEAKDTAKEVVTDDLMKFSVPIFSTLPDGEGIEIAPANHDALTLLAPVRNAEPPKEKPPPPPLEELDAAEETETIQKSVNIKRANSTRRIRDELRSKRSSFLGIEDDESSLMSSEDLIPPKPPDITAFLCRERELEQQMYRQSLNCDGINFGDASESRDSGVELDHRSQSDQSTWSSASQTPVVHQDEKQMNIIQSTNSDDVARKEQEIIERLERDERSRQQQRIQSDINKHYPIENHQPSTKLQITVGKNPFEHDNTDVGNDKEYRLQDCLKRYDIHNNDLSFDDEQSEEVLRVERELLQLEQEELRRQRECLQQRREWVPPIAPQHPLVMKHYASAHDVSVAPIDVQMYKRRPPAASPNKPVSSDGTQMSRNTLHALSCTPRSRHIDSWVLQKRKSEPPVMNYNQHWLIQEAEQRRIEQQKGLKSSNNQLWLQQQTARPEKHISNPNMQPITQRPHNRSSLNLDKLNRRYDGSNICNIMPQNQSQEKMLSVSGKKKCSHCGDELGRGAAMIIESLQLFYHIDCFKCCVCRVQLGDGLIGTDVRVRNHKLHCHNCYSSDDGVKFSCV